MDHLPAKYSEFDSKDVIESLNWYFKETATDEYIHHWIKQNIRRIRRELRLKIDIELGENPAQMGEWRLPSVYRTLIVKLELYNKPKMAEHAYNHYKKVVLGK